MISSKVSGVCFTVNPLSGNDEFVVELAEGYGEQIVSGQINPNRCVIPKSYSELPPSILPEKVLTELLQNAQKISELFNKKMVMRSCFIII
jgi:phosphoenolpyruvate synthase/pyruvate phosphate dikinase